MNLRGALLAVLLLAPATFAATTNNDDSCDIGVYPAATLLLPFFEVDQFGNTRYDTLFTITNVGAVPQIAHVTIWTDWAFPVLNFNIFLTGFDTQSISLYDVIMNGIIAPPGGTSGSSVTGSLSASNGANPNLSTEDCNQLPGTLSLTLRNAVRNALTTGIYNSPGFSLSCGSNPVGSPSFAHPTATMAVGYVTIDVTSRCTATSPSDPSYYVNEILFDNVLTGDYSIVQLGAIAQASGGPLVHIRAIPEGGPAGTSPPNPPTNLSSTFYDRYIAGRAVGRIPIASHLDRRQPLPSTFAAPWFSGGIGALDTQFTIWREGTSAAPACNNASQNSAMSIEEIVRFDQHENPTAIWLGYQPPCSVTCTPFQFSLPAAARPVASSSLFPPTLSNPGDNSGWMYMNLDNHLVRPRASQNWVTTWIGTSTYGAEVTATSLGNGCTPPVPLSTATEKGTTPLGPAPNANP